MSTSPGRYPFDPAKAKALLKQAGWPPGTKLKVVLPPPNMRVVAGKSSPHQLRKVGLEVEIVPMEWAQWLSDVFKARNYDLTVISHVEPLDLDIYARDDYYFDYKLPAYKALIPNSSDVRSSKRPELYGKAQQMLADDAVNVFLFLLPKWVSWNAKLKGLWDNAPIPANDLTEVGWKN